VQRVSNYSTPILQLGGTYFATDLGSEHLVDVLLRNRSTAFGTLFTMGNGYRESALRRVPHPAFGDRETWVHRTDSQWLGDDYWFAFAGDPGKAPNGSNPGFTSTIGLMPFTDIGDSPWQGAIVWVYQHGIMDGCTATRFCPDRYLTRGQLAGALAKALRLPAADRDYFADDAGHRYEDAINRLRAAGLTSGCGNGNYCPDRAMRRGKLAVVLDRVLDLPATTANPFGDDNGTAAEGAINRVAAADIMRGCAADRFCPDRRVRREHAANFLRRAFD
jgi:hypothetical protein